MCVGGRSKKNMQYKSCKSQATNTDVCAIPKECTSETNRLLQNEQKLKSLLSSPGFWKLIQKLETVVSPRNSNIINDLLDGHNEQTPSFTPKDAPVVPNLSTNSSISVANPISVERSLKTVSEKTSTDSFAFQAITINPQRLSTESKNSSTTLEKNALSSDRADFQEIAKCSKCVQTVRKGQRNGVDDSNSSNTTSNVSERKFPNSSKTTRKTSQRSRANQETSSTDLRHKVRYFTQSHSVSAYPNPKLRIPIRKIQAKKYSPTFIQTFRNPRATSRVPVSKPEFRRVSPINFNKKPKLKGNRPKANAKVISKTSLESGKFSVNAISPTSTSSHVPIDTMDKRKANAKPENTSSKEKQKVTEQDLSVSSIPSSDVSKKLFTPTLASPGVSTYSEISLNRNKQENIPKSKETSDFNLKQGSFQENLKMMQHHSIEYVYQNTRRAEIELAARKDSGSIATKLSGRVDPVPQTDIYSMFYKSQIFDPKSKGRTPKRYERISSKIKNPQKGVQVAVGDVNPTWKAGKLSKRPSDVQVEKGNQFVDVFKLLEESHSSHEALPANRSPDTGWKSILKTSSKENKTRDKYYNQQRNFLNGKKKPSAEVNNKKPGNQVKKSEAFPSKKGSLLRRLKTIFDNPNKIVSTAQDSAVNSSLNLPVAPLSSMGIANRDKIVTGLVNNTNQSIVSTASKRLPFSKDTQVSAGKTNKKSKKLGVKTASRQQR